MRAPMPDQAGGIGRHATSELDGPVLSRVFLGWILFLSANSSTSQLTSGPPAFLHIPGSHGDA